MPAFTFHGILLYYAAFKNHYGLFIKPDVLAKYKDQLSDYKTAKATLQIQYHQDLPEVLLIKILQDCAQMILNKKSKKLPKK